MRKEYLQNFQMYAFSDEIQRHLSKQKQENSGLLQAPVDYRQVVLKVTSINEVTNLKKLSEKASFCLSFVYKLKNERNQERQVAEIILRNSKRGVKELA